MNRQERRAEAARARAASAKIDKGFEDYRAQARRAFPGIDDKKIGEAWMRGQIWTAIGADAMIIHCPGEAPARHDDDVTVSATWGALEFKAFISRKLLHESIEQWGKFITDFAAGDSLHDPRAYTRAVILHILIEQRHVRGDGATMLVAAIAWLTATLSAAKTLFGAGRSPRRIHHQITDTTDGQNFRMVLDSSDGPFPEWIKTAPPRAGEK
jgi:hypothetical protein